MKKLVKPYAAFVVFLLIISLAVLTVTSKATGQTSPSSLWLPLMQNVGETPVLQPTVTPTLTETPTVQPTNTLTPEPTATETPSPSSTSTIEPPNTPTIIPTEPPTFTPTLTDTPTATPTETGSVTITSSTAFRPYDGSPNLYLVGAIRNDTMLNTSFMRIHAILRDSSGAIIASSSNFTTFTILSPGQVSPFRTIFGNVPTFSNYELTVSWATETHGPVELTILNPEPYFDSLDAFHVRGAVLNQTNEDRYSTKVAVLMLDANDQVIGTDYLIIPATLAPGQSATFDVDVFSWAGKPDRNRVASYRVIAI